jgi:hypothetical protein
MHVRGLVLLCCLSVACSKSETKKPLKLDLSFAEPEAGVVAADDTPAEYMVLARAALDAATKLASKCDLHESGYETTVRFVDSCAVWSTADVEALKKAWSALDASPLAPEAGLAIGFLRRLRFFEQWVSSFEKSALGYWPRVSGTLLYYQDVALAWTDWRPQTVVRVDVGNTRYTKVDAGPSGHLEWGRCSEGTCILKAKANVK